MKKQAGHGELELIEQIRKGQPARKGAMTLGIGDDCAILRPPAGSEVLVTTDFTLEGRHFRRDLHPATSVGHRCLARGLSDLAAMGAKPMSAFLSLALPPQMLTTASGRRWMKAFFRGLRALGDRTGVPLAGGDTAQAPGDLVLADIVLVGSAPAGRALRRSGGRAGDLLYCTGRLGGAAAELERMLERGKMAVAKIPAGHPQLFPEPRLEVGQALLRRGLATACLDLSDGLSSDLAHLCKESNLGAELEEDLLPVHPLAARLGRQRGLGLALHGGEDYELLFSAPAETKVPRRVAGVEVTRIGRLVRGAGITLVRQDGQQEPLVPGGWEHFRSPSE